MRNLVGESVIDQVLHAGLSREMLDIHGVAGRIRSLCPNEAPPQEIIEAMILEAVVARRVAVQRGPQQRG
jgi:hypothetical protein